MDSALEMDNCWEHPTRLVEKELTSRMNPDFLTFDSNAVQAQFEAGEAAIANNWGSRAAKVAAGAEALGGSITHAS
ncbi:MAG: hypothetical protein ACO3OB_09915, partial [bacterium]